MPSDSTATRLAGNFGLHINTVAWEDNGRTKGSCWGPCISDMTLQVRGSALPLVRYPNFEDLTWYVKRSIDTPPYSYSPLGMFQSKKFLLL